VRGLCPHTRNRLAFLTGKPMINEQGLRDGNILLRISGTGESSC